MLLEAISWQTAKEAATTTIQTSRHSNHHATLSLLSIKSTVLNKRESSIQAVQKTIFTRVVTSETIDMLELAALLRQVVWNPNAFWWSAIVELKTTPHRSLKLDHASEDPSPSSSNPHKVSHITSTTAILVVVVHLLSTKAVNTSQWARKDLVRFITRRRENLVRSTQQWPWNWCIINLLKTPCHKQVKLRDHPGGAECVKAQRYFRTNYSALMRNELHSLKKKEQR